MRIPGENKCVITEGATEIQKIQLLAAQREIPVSGGAGIAFVGRTAVEGDTFQVDTQVVLKF